MKYKHATWRKLYVDEDGSFARLPFTARAYAKQLLCLCDDAGRIDVGDGDDVVKLLVHTAGFRMGATRGDRRMMAMMFPLLFDEGYLVRRGRFVVIRNFVAAQRRWSDDEETPAVEPPAPEVPEASETPAADPVAATTEPRPSNDGATKLQRPSNEAATTEQRTGNEAATKPELSARKHDDADASAHARARSSVPSSSEKKETPLTPQGGQGTLGEVQAGPRERPARRPTRPKSTLPPMPFQIDEMLDALHEASGGRVVIDPYPRNLSKRLTDVIRDLGPAVTLADVRLAGAYIATWPERMLVDCSWLATTGKLAGAIGKARAWRRPGGPVVVAPSPDAWRREFEDPTPEAVARGA